MLVELLLRVLAIPSLREIRINQKTTAEICETRKYILVCFQRGYIYVCDKTTNCSTVECLTL